MFIVEGNIGAGKSTFLALAKEHLPNVSVALEPLHNWQQEVAGNSLLQQFYQAPQRWAYTLETYAMACRALDHLREQNIRSAKKLMERSIYSGHYCFAKNGYKEGFMSELEWSLYNKWFDFLIPGKCDKPSGFIYLKTDPSIAHERVIKRSRQAESTLSLSYLKQIDASHDEFLIEKKGVHQELIDVPVLILDCNKEFETNTKQLESLLAQVDSFMNNALI